MGEVTDGSRVVYSTKNHNQKGVTLLRCGTAFLPAPNATAKLFEMIVYVVAILRNLSLKTDDHVFGRPLIRNGYKSWLSLTRHRKGDSTTDAN